MQYFFFFSSRRRHTRWTGDWSSDVCSSDLQHAEISKALGAPQQEARDTALRLAALHRRVLHQTHARTDACCLRAPTKDRKSTRLNSSHPSISYAVFCLKKKKKQKPSTRSTH